MRHRDGHWVWVLDRGKVIEWAPDGTPLWMFGTHTDITERKRMEEEIRELATRDALTGLANRRSVVLRVNDRGPTDPGRIGDVSLAAAKRLGMTKSGVIDAELVVVSARATKKR
jgi:hypothetical protein